jgi:transposase-like protein
MAVRAPFACKRSITRCATKCLKKDRDAQLMFYDLPAEHWKHLRTTNPIESTFATVRHRTIRSKGCLSNRTALGLQARRSCAEMVAAP